MSSHRVVVVGGGLSGLCTAFYLARKGVSVSLLERRAVLGGLSAGEDVQGVRVDRHYHHLMRSDGHALDLLDLLGLTRDIRWHRSSVSYCRHGRVHPMSGPSDFLRLRLLSKAGRLRFLLGQARVSVSSYHRSLEHTPVVDWAREVFGEEATRRIWVPLLSSRWGEALPLIPAVWLWQRLKKRLGSRGVASERLGYPEHGFRGVVDTLVDRVRSMDVEITAGVEVDRVSRHGDGVQVHTSRGEQRADAIVLAAPFPDVVDLPGPGLDGRTAAARAVEYQGTISAILVTDRPLTGFYWNNVADPSLPFCAIVEQTQLESPRRYGGQHVTYVTRYLSAGDHSWGWPDGLVVERFWAGIQGVYPGAGDANLLGSLVVRDPHTHAVRGTGFADIARTFLAPRAQVFWVNDALSFPDDRGLDVCAEVAYQTAKRIRSRIH